MQDNGSTQDTVTRMEIVDAIESAFNSPPATKRQIVAAAEDARARAALVDVLRRLPDGSYQHVRNLWEYLPDVPVDV